MASRRLSVHFLSLSTHTLTNLLLVTAYLLKPVTRITNRKSLFLNSVYKSVHYFFPLGIAAVRRSGVLWLTAAPETCQDNLAVSYPKH